MAIAVGVASVAVGIGIPVFYESQIDNAVSIISQLEYRKMVFTQLFILILEVLTKYMYEYEYMIMICLYDYLLQSKRENTQPCFPCAGSGARKWLHSCLICYH